MPVTCPKCNRTFRDNYNLTRHLEKDIDCATTTNQTTPLVCAQLMDSLLFYLRGPLQIPREYAQDEAYVTKVVTSVWRAVVSVAQQKPGRTFELVVRLLELLNVGQLELLYGTIMANVEPPDTAMKMSLQALYQHVGTLHRKGIASLHGKSTGNVLRAMERLPGLVVGE